MGGEKKRQSVPDDSAVSSQFRLGLGDVELSPVCSVELEGIASAAYRWRVYETTSGDLPQRCEEVVTKLSPDFVLGLFPGT